jgi:hypothetical protein
MACQKASLGAQVRLLLPWLRLNEGGKIMLEVAHQCIRTNCCLHEQLTSTCTHCTTVPCNIGFTPTLFGELFGQGSWKRGAVRYGFAAAEPSDRQNSNSPAQSYKQPTTHSMCSARGGLRILQRRAFHLRCMLDFAGHCIQTPKG